MEFRIRDGPGGFQYLKMPQPGPLSAAEGDLLPELCSRDEFAAQLAQRLNRVSIARIALYLTVATGSFLLGSTFASLAVLPLVGALAVVLAVGFVIAYGLAGKLDHARRSTVLIYEWYAGSIAPYEHARNACRAAAEARRVTGRIAGQARRRRIAIEELSIPHLWVNVETWGIDAGPRKIVFLPDGVLTVVERDFRIVAYDQVSATGEIAHEAELGALPDDARVVGYRSRDDGKDGARGARRADRRRIPLIENASVTVQVAGIGDLELSFSNADAGLRFRDLLNQARLEAVVGSARPRSFGTTWERLRFAGQARSQRDAAPIARTAAYDVLGVSPGATLPEIGAAYRALAQRYHPDRHATQPQDLRELAERRMKEINAAYAEIKRRLGRAPAVD